MVLPPTVLGYYLILLLGQKGLFGPALRQIGFQFMFSWQGAVVAATVVVFPLIYKSAKTALEQVDVNVENAARTLGASESSVFFYQSSPGRPGNPVRFHAGVCPWHGRIRSDIDAGRQYPQQDTNAGAGHL